MADTKISQMPGATDFSGSDFAPIVKAGSNQKIFASTLFGNIKDPVHINIDNEDNDTIIEGQNDANLIFVDASSDRVGFGVSTPSEKVHVEGNILVNGIEVFPSSQTQTSTGPVTLLKRRIIFDNPSTANATVAAGKEGQRIVLIRKNSGSVVISAGSGAAFIGGTTITLSSVGSSVTLEFVSGYWYIVSAYSITVA